MQVLQVCIRQPSVENTTLYSKYEHVYVVAGVTAVYIYIEAPPES